MSHSSEIRVLRVRPGQAPEQIQIPNTLSAFQQEVGGWIETVSLGDGAILICNEEGKLTGMDGNRRLGNDIIVVLDALSGQMGRKQLHRPVRNRRTGNALGVETSSADS